MNIEYLHNNTCSQFNHAQCTTNAIQLSLIRFEQKGQQKKSLEEKSQAEEVKKSLAKKSF